MNYANPVLRANQQMNGVGIDRPAQVPEALGNLSVQIDGLEKQIESLTQKLVPVILTQPVEGLKDQPAPAPMLAPLADNLKHSAMRVAGLVNRLYELERSIEL